MKKRKWVIGGLVLVLICMAVCFSNPQVRTKIFVSRHSDEIEKSISQGQGISSRVKAKYFNAWEGEHDMMEFVLLSYGNRYYGCYYSYDDVPLAFQNTQAELVSNADHVWEWTAEGDNHGQTKKIKDNWYYFEAWF